MLNMIYPCVPSWAIFDEERRTSGAIVSSGSTWGYGFLPWTNDNLDAIERGWILQGDTLEELAQKILEDPENRDLLDVETLLETVEKFNHYCETGVDEEFGRNPDTMGAVATPPFYAVKLYPGGPNTKGGLDADAARRVLDWSGNPIPRLYTAGEISSVFKFTYQGGGNVSECIVCGRIAGQNAATETTWD